MGRGKSQPDAISLPPAARRGIRIAGVGAVLIGAEVTAAQLTSANSPVPKSSHAAQAHGVPQQPSGQQTAAQAVVASAAAVNNMFSTKAETYDPLLADLNPAKAASEHVLPLDAAVDTLQMELDPLNRLINPFATISSVPGIAVGTPHIVRAGHHDYVDVVLRARASSCSLIARDKGHVQESIVKGIRRSHLAWSWTIPKNAKASRWNLTVKCIEGGSAAVATERVTVKGPKAGHLHLWSQSPQVKHKGSVLPGSSPSPGPGPGPGPTNPGALDVSLSTQSPVANQPITLTIDNPTPGTNYQYTWDVCSAPGADCAGINGETTATITVPTVCQFNPEYLEGTAYVMSNGVPTQIGGATAQNPIQENC